MSVGEQQSTAARVGIAVVERHGSYLIGRRGPDGPLADANEFPGGKCHSGESAAECAVRECFEETGLMVDIDQLLLQRTFDYPHGTIDLSFFLCSVVGTPEAPITGFRWVKREELGELDFPAANDEVVARLMDGAPNCAARTQRKR